MVELHKFMASLKRHPGVPVVTVLMVLGFIAGAKGEHWYIGGMVGVSIMCVFWVPVLWTAWGMRNSA